MKIRIELLEDAVFGSGQSVPGAEDSSVLYDKDGFPYLRGTTLKGLLRECFENHISWTGGNEDDIKKLFGDAGTDIEDERKIFVSDAVLPYEARKFFYGCSAESVLEACTFMRTFTKIDDGKASNGSLRKVRCIKKGLVFYSNIEFADEDKELVRSAVSSLKWIGSMRTRGMGKVRTEVLL